MDTKTHLKCTDCAHAFCSPSTTLARWFKTQHGWMCRQAVISGHTDIVTGQATADSHDFCNFERSAHGACGPDAVKWLPRNSRRGLFQLLSRS